MNNRPNPIVICLGEILDDRIADQVAGTIAAVQSWTDYAGGAPANVACGLSQLGTPTALIAAVGDDDRGRKLVALLQAQGVDATGVQTITTHPTRSVLVLRSADGDRTFAGFGDDRPTTAFADTQLQAAALPEALFRSAKFLVLGSLGLATPTSAAAVMRAIALARQHRLQILLDVNWRPVFWPQPAVAPGVIAALIRQVDWLKLSIEESEWLCDTIDPGRIQTLFPQLKGVWITRGADGCDYWLNGHMGHQPSFPVVVQDTTGAGDGFVAGLVHQLCQGDTNDVADPAAAISADRSKTIVAYACAVGALTTTQIGAIAAQPTAAQVIELLNQPSG
jgi:fructokinase